MLKKSLCILAMFLLTTSLQGMAQSPVRVIKFAELEKLMQQSSDTLHIINFWATWCKPCIAELPNFEKANAAYKNKNVKIVLVSLDFAEDLTKKLIPFVKKRNIQSEVVLLDEMDYNAWIDKVSPAWQGDIPATLIFNNARKQRAFYAKEFKEGELEKLIESQIQ